MVTTPPSSADRSQARPRLTVVSTSATVQFGLPPVLADLSRFRETLRSGQPGRQRHALLIDSALPSRGGPGAFVIPSLARALRRLGFHVSFCPVDGTVTRATDELAGSELAEAGAACLGLPAYRSVEEVLRCQAELFDLVVLQGAGLARAYEPLVRLHAPSARVLFSAGALQHRRLARQAELQGGADLSRAARDAQRLEVMAAYACDATLVHTAQEAEVLRRLLPGTAAVHVVPFALPPAEPRQRRDRHGVGFHGCFADPAALDAALVLVNQVMPLVWEESPSIRLLIGGSEPPAALRSLACDRVAVIGAVGQLSGLLDQVGAMAAPLRFGSGVQPEVLASLAAGIPCAMTPVAAEGLRPDPGLDAMVAEDAAGLARVILAAHRRPRANPAWREAIRGDWSDAAVEAALRPALGRATRRRLAAL